MYRINLFDIKPCNKKYNGIWQSLVSNYYRLHSNFKIHNILKNRTSKKSTKIYCYVDKFIQKDNRTKFTYKYMSDNKICHFDKAPARFDIIHKLILPEIFLYNRKTETSFTDDE